LNGLLGLVDERIKQLKEAGLALGKTKEALLILDGVLESVRGECAGVAVALGGVTPRSLAGLELDDGADGIGFEVRDTHRLQIANIEVLALVGLERLRKELDTNVVAIEMDAVSAAALLQSVCASTLRCVASETNLLGDHLDFVVKVIGFDDRHDLGKDRDVLKEGPQLKGLGEGRVLVGLCLCNGHL